MIRRYLQEQVLLSLRHFPAVLLTGARQVGKSTLAQALISPSWKARYVTLDDRIVLDAALRDPDGFIEGLEIPAVIDEVQRAPDLLRAVKKAIDQERKPGRYLLTGSANIMTLSSVAETLAGRVVLHTLHPFAWSEVLGKAGPSALNSLFEAEDARALQKKIGRHFKRNYRASIVQSILRGGYPPAALMSSAQARAQWFSSYRQTYIERDLLSLKSIEHLPDFSRLLSLAAIRTGRLLNLSDFSRETGLPYSTLRRYMNLLQLTYQIFLVQPYHTHLGKRLVKTPKLYFNDTGMACHLIGTDDWAVLEKMGQTGPLVESWTAAELLKLMSFSDTRFKLYFWRTQTGQEVDFIIERGERLAAIEVKWSGRIEDTAVRNLGSCLKDLGPRLAFSAILYGGDEIVPLGPKLIALPFSAFFGIGE